MPNKILVDASGTPIVWASDLDYDGSGGAETHNIELSELLNAAAHQGDVADLDRNDVVNRFPAKFTVTIRMAYEADNLPTAGATVDLYWVPSTILTGPFPDGIVGDAGAYTGTTGSSLEESLKQLQFLGSLILTTDGKDVPAQQTTFTAILPTQFGVPIIVNNGHEPLADDGEFLSVTFTPYEYEVQ